MADEGNGSLIKELLPPLVEELRRGIVQDVVASAREDIQSLLAATQRGPAPPPPPQIEWLRKDLVSAVGDAVRKETSEFLPEEEIEERIAKVTATIDRRLDGFEANFLEKVRQVVKGEIDKFREEIFDVFDGMDLALEKGEPRKKTAERIRGMIAIVDGSKEFKREAFSQIVKAFGLWIAGLLAIALGVIGIKTGGGH